MSVPAGIAYGAWVVVLASFCGTLFFPARVAVSASARRSVPEAGAACAALAAFYMVPPGSLPPFFDVPWNGLIFAGCLVFAAAILLKQRAPVPCLAVCVVCGAFFYFALQRGMPGSPANLGTFAAMPVWEIASLPEMGALALLGAGLLLSLRDLLPDRRSTLSGILLYLAAGALFVTLLLPWNAASFVSWPAPLVAGTDFLLFWAKVLACCFLISRMPPRGWYARSGLIMGALGALFLAVLSR